MSERSSIIRKKFFAEHSNPDAAIEPAKPKEVVEMLGEFSLDEEKDFTKKFDVSLDITKKK